MLLNPLWKYGALGSTILSLCLLGSTIYFRHDRNNWVDIATNMLTAIKHASDNEDVTFKSAPDQILAIGDSNRVLKISLDQQNAKINEMAKEAIRLKADQKRLEEIANKAIAQRKTALEQLNKKAITPGKIQDCKLLVQEAEEALDLVYITLHGETE